MVKKIAVAFFLLALIGGGITFAAGGQEGDSGSQIR